VKGEHTEICSCTVLELAAIDRAIRGDRQYMLLLGRLRWTRRDRQLLERLRNVRGLNVIEDHQDGSVYVTIAGTLKPGGFTKVIEKCQNRRAWPSKENSNG
jgi:hypothetical protein